MVLISPEQLHQYIMRQRYIYDNPDSCLTIAKKFLVATFTACPQGESVPKGWLAETYREYKQYLEENSYDL